ncbi:hypothetical protein AT728_16085 [Streptomyces silvensis]|uniref:Uncharacterized protein n=1 Tax=Streptomyces silvensis TaxID=1765722 RepID=A0A0W7X393_9ACTN|nr:hypothetical protein AT728_16085 [Streptomyces silvensis]
MVPLSALDADATANACSVSHEDAAAILRQLDDAHLLKRLGPQPGREVAYRFTEAGREHAHQHARTEDSVDVVDDAVRRAGSWLLATFTRAERILTPHHRQLDRDLHHQVPAYAFADDNPAAALLWVEAHLPDVKLMAREARRRDWHEMAWQLVHAAWPAFHHLRPLELSWELHSLGVQAAEACGNRVALREMLTTGAIALRGLRRVQVAFAWAERASVLALEDGDLRGRAQANHELGVCSRELGLREAAVQYLYDARVWREDSGDRRGAALTRIVQGQIHLDDGRPQKAIDRVGPAHTDLRDVNDPINAGRACLVLAEAHAHLDRLPRTLGLLDEAHTYFERAGHPPGQARVLKARGRLAQKAGRIDEARTCYTAALNLYPQSSPDAADIAALLKGLPEQRASPSA